MPNMIGGGAILDEMEVCSLIDIPCFFKIRVATKNWSKCHSYLCAPSPRLIILSSNHFPSWYHQTSKTEKVVGNGSNSKPHKVWRLINKEAK